jgi:hypothetical protein
MPKLYPLSMHAVYLVTCVFECFDFQVQSHEWSLATHLHSTAAIRREVILTESFDGSCAGGTKKFCNLSCSLFRDDSTNCERGAR